MWVHLLYWVEFIEFIGVLRHMQRYFSHICDDTDVQVDWWRSCTYGRAPNAIEISQGSLTCPSYTDTGPPFLYGDSDTPPHLVAFYDTLGIRRMYSRLKPPAPSRGTESFYEKVRNIRNLSHSRGIRTLLISSWTHVKRVRQAMGEERGCRTRYSFWVDKGSWYGR